MSSTNVRSAGKVNKRIVAGQTIADENGKIEIPPTASKKGPSVFDAKQGDIIEIKVEDGILHQDGTLTSLDGKEVATYDAKAFEDAKKRQGEKAQKGKASKEDRESDR